MVDDQLQAAHLGAVHILHKAEQGRGARDQRRRLRKKGAGDVFLEQRQAHKAAVGPAFRRQFVGTGAFGPQVGIGHRQHRPGGDGLVKLGHRRHAKGHAPGAGHLPVIRYLPGQAGLGRQGAGGDARLADIECGRSGKIAAGIGAPVLIAQARRSFQVGQQGPDILQPHRIGRGSAFGGIDHRTEPASDPVGEVVAGLGEGLSIAVQAEGNLVIGQAAPRAIGIQRIPAGAVHAVDGSGTARESRRQGGGGDPLLVAQIGIVAGDDLPGEVAVLRRRQREALGQLALLGVVDIVGKAAGGDVVIIAVDVAAARIDGRAGGIAQPAVDIGIVVLAEQAGQVGQLPAIVQVIG